MFHFFSYILKNMKLQLHLISHLISVSQMLSFFSRISSFWVEGRVPTVLLIAVASFKIRANSSNSYSVIRPAFNGVFSVGSSPFTAPTQPSFKSVKLVETSTRGISYAEYQLENRAFTVYRGSLLGPFA